MQSLFKKRYVIIVIIINAIVSFFIKPIVLLNENQILYLMSTLSQVIAGLFGLVLAAYAIIDPKLKDIGTKDKQSSDFVDILRERYYKNIIFLSIMCAITILSSLLILNTYTYLPNKLFSIIINQSIIFGVLCIISFLYFGCSLLNPNALKDISEEEKKEIESNYTPNNTDTNFMPFIQYYNKLYELIIDYSTYLLEIDLHESKSENKNNRHMQIFQALDILMINKIINKDMYEKINEFRRYRNVLAHSTDSQKVNSLIFEQLKEVFKKLNTIYEQKDNKDNQQKSIVDLFNYGKEISLSDRDKDILSIINNNDGISAKEIAKELGISRSYVNKFLIKLYRLDKIIEKDNKFYKNNQ